MIGHMGLDPLNLPPALPLEKARLLNSLIPELTVVTGMEAIVL